MKIAAIFGSPNTRGSSSELHEIFLSASERAGITVMRIHVYQSDIMPCTDCGICRTENRCIHDDDMNEVYEHIRSADALTISSPVYFSSLPGPLKNLIDRCQLFWEARKRNPNPPRKRPAYFLATAGSLYPQVFSPSLTIIRHFYNSLDFVFNEKDFFLLAGLDKLGTVPKESREKLVLAGNDFAQTIMNVFEK